jgi:ferritin-like metal-binding protein YciE
MTGQHFGMDSKTHVIKQLDEAHAVETALVSNLTAHIAMTTDEPYRKVLERHLKETKDQTKAIDRRRKDLGADAGRGIVSATIGVARDAVGQILVLSKGPIDALRTPSQAERMLKNARDECATEAIEIAVYDALETMARAAGDTETAKLAAAHRRQEERMLGDLRKHIVRLAHQSYEAQTGERAKATVKDTQKRTGAVASA